MMKKFSQKKKLDSYDELLEIKNDFFENMSKKARKFFLDNDYIPENYYDANNFINSLLRVGEINEIGTIIFKGKKYVFKPSDYYAALYPAIWQVLNLEEKANVLFWAYTEMAKEKGFKDDKYRMVWITFDGESSFGGFCDFITREIGVSFDDLLSDEVAIQISTVALMAHELQHHTQQQRTEYLCFNNMKNIDNLYELHNMIPLARCISKIFKDKQLQSEFLTKENLEYYNSIKHNQDWIWFLKNIYYGNESEIAAGNKQTKTLEELFKKSYGYFNEELPQEVFELIKRTSEIYSKEIADKSYFGLRPYILCLEDLTNFSYVEYLQNKCDLLDYLKELRNLPDDKYDEKVYTQRYNDLLNRENLCKDNISKCINAFIEIYKTHEFPEWFDKSLFNLIYDKMFDRCAIPYKNMTKEKLIETYKKNNFVEEQLKKEYNL